MGVSWRVGGPYIPVSMTTISMLMARVCGSFHNLSFSVCLSLFLSDVLALPIFKQEDVSVPVESDTKNPPFQYVMCAATSPAVKLHEETLTYLNQGMHLEDD